MFTIVKIKEEYHCAYSSDIKENKVLEYFTKGIGWKKTKKYQVIKAITTKDLTWLDIARYSIEFGDIVGEQLSGIRGCGANAWVNNMFFKAMYLKAEHILKDKNESRLFEILPYSMLIYYGIISLDIVALDNKLAQLYPDYNSIECTYKVKMNISTQDFIEIEFGKDGVELIKCLLNFKNN